MNNFEIFTLIRVEIDKFLYMAKPWPECLEEIKRLTDKL